MNLSRRNFLKSAAITAVAAGTMGLIPALAEQTDATTTPDATIVPTPTPAQKNPDTMNYTEPYMVTLHPATEMNIIWLTKEICSGYVEYGATPALGRRVEAVSYRFEGLRKSATPKAMIPFPKTTRNWKSASSSRR